MTQPTPNDNELMQTALDQRRYVWLSFGKKCFMGFILGLSDSLVLIHRFRDFEDTGYAVIRRSAVDEVTCSLSDDGRSLRFFEEMMKGEGLLERVGIPYEVPLDSFASVVEAVRKQYLLMLFQRGPHESEDDDGDDDLHVGWLNSADDLHVRTTCVTSYGEWFQDACEFETLKLQHVEFGSPYLKALRKYASPYRKRD